MYYIKKASVKKHAWATGTGNAQSVVNAIIPGAGAASNVWRMLVWALSIASGNGEVEVQMRPVLPAFWAAPSREGKPLQEEFHFCKWPEMIGIFSSYWIHPLHCIVNQIKQRVKNKSELPLFPYSLKIIVNFFKKFTVLFTALLLML